MKIRSFMTFEAEFPDDAEFRLGGSPLKPSGENVANVLAQTLQRAGTAVTAPKQHSFYGWQFYVSEGGCTFWFLLQFPGPWLLLRLDKRPIIARWLRPCGKTHGAVLNKLCDALAQDVRFKDICRYTKEEYEKL